MSGASPSSTTTPFLAPGGGGGRTSRKSATRSRTTRNRVLSALALAGLLRVAFGLSWTWAAPSAAAVAVAYWYLAGILRMGLPTETTPGLLGAVSMSGCSIQ